MSWLDQIKTQLTITTGDGQSYMPQWMNAKKRLGFNIAKFEFPHVPGSLVSRKEALGMEYELEIYFQGDGGVDKGPNVGNGYFDYLVATKLFEESAKDKRAWILKHPFYGQITVQPVAMNIDNSQFNVSKITCTIIETISQDYPIAIKRPVDLISLDAITTSQLLSSSTANSDVITKIPPANISAKAINNTKSSFAKFQASVAKAINSANTDFQSYMNLYNQAYNTTSDLIDNPQQVLNLLQAVITKPATFVLALNNRLALLTGQLTTLELNITGTMSNLDKLLYMTLGGGCISAMALACANLQPNDLIYSIDTLNTISLILTYYNQYLLDLDNMQTINGGNTNSFIPDHDSLVALEELVNFTLSNLFNIAVNGQQQRSILLESDSNWIVLTHRFYGLDQQDANLLTLLQQNNAGLNSLLIVPKNTKVIYYI